MKKSLILIVLLFLILALSAGCARPMMPDDENAVEAVFFDHVYDEEEIPADEEETAHILKLYAECKKFARNRSLAGITPPKPVEIRIDWDDGQSTRLYLNGGGKVGICDADGTYWLVKNQALMEYLESMQNTCENPE